MAQELKFDLPAPKPAKSGGSAMWVIAALLIGVGAGFALRSGGVCGVGRTCPIANSTTGGLMNAEELAALAETLERNQVYGQAAKTWQQVAEANPPRGPDKADMLFRIGKNLSLAGEYEAALAYLFAAETADQQGLRKASINKLVLDGLSALGKEDARAYQARRRTSLEADADKEKDPVVAEIGGERITEQDLQTFARRMVTDRMSMQKSFMPPEAFAEAVDKQLAQFKTADGRKQLLQMYIGQELLYREALAGKLEEDTDVRQKLLEARRAVLTSAFLDDYLAKNIQIGDTDIQNAYEAHKADYVEPEAVKVEAIVVDDEKKRDEVDTALAAGGDFSGLRASHSTLKVSEDVPDVFDRWLTREGRVPMVTENNAALAHLFALQQNEVGGKWFTGQGGKFIRFRLVERRAERQLPLDECRPRVERDLRERKQKDVLDQLQQALQKKFQVVIHESEETKK